MFFFADKPTLQMPRLEPIEANSLKLVFEKLLDREIPEWLIENISECCWHEIVDQRFDERKAWLPSVVYEKVGNIFYHNSSTKQMRNMKLHVSDLVYFNIDF